MRAVKVTGTSACVHACVRTCSNIIRTNDTWIGITHRM